MWLRLVISFGSLPNEIKYNKNLCKLMAAYERAGSTYKPFYKDKKFTVNIYYTNKGVAEKPKTKSVQDTSSGTSRSIFRETSRTQTNSYMKFYQTNCQAVDSMTFSQVKKDVLQMLKDPNAPPEVKIMLGDWLFRKVSRCFRMSEDVLKETCGDLTPPIDKCQNTISKSLYLQFTNIDSVGIIALHFYLNRFTHRDKFFILQLLNDTQLVKNYIRDARITEDSLRSHFLGWLKSSSVFEQQSCLLDTLLKYYNQDPEVAQVYNKMRWGRNKEQGTLYEDEQNVHDEGIKQSSLDAAEKLLEKDSIAPIKVPPMMKFRDFVTGMLYPLYPPNEKSTIDCVVERMCIDTTYFGDGFTISDLFLAIISYILRSKHKQELLKRLLEEMIEMRELCGSGYVVRLINVLQGFDDGEYTVTISFDKQLYAVISKALAESMETVSDQVIEESMTQGEVYLKHVCDIVNKNINQMIDDYGRDDVNIHIISVVSTITGYDKWEYKNQVLSF